MLDDVYNNKIIELAANISHIGRLKNPSKTATKVSRLCGSKFTVDVVLSDNIVTDFAHEVKACALGQASSSIMAKNIIGSTVDELLNISEQMKKMLKEKKGNIVIVSSAASNVKGVPNRFIYGTTKAALNGFVKAIAIDHIKDGIRCNAILPGTVETPSWEGRVNMADDPVKARSDFIARQAMGRLAQPEEIASLATYLASDESDFVTGTLNLIDGGWTL